MDQLTAISINLTVNLLIILLPLGFLYMAGTTWLMYRRTKYNWYKQRKKLFKLNLPPEVVKSPRAIEVICSIIWQQAKSVGGIDQVYWDGRNLREVSFEIASEAGAVNFYMSVPSSLVDLTINAFYAQYPGIEIEEVEDYLPTVDELIKERIFYGMYWRKKKPPPDPIVTYTYYQHEANPDETVKVDPMLNLVEYLGSLGYGEAGSYQFVFRPNVKKEWVKGTAWPFMRKPDLHQKTHAWIKETKVSMTDYVKDSAGTTYERTNWLPGEPEKIKRFRDLDDQDTFDLYVRGIYYATPESFKGYRVSNMTGAIKQFSHAGGNDIGTGFETGTSDEEEAATRWIPWFGAWWQEWTTRRRKRSFALAFKRRVAFSPPHAGHGVNSLNEVFSEELATFYHLPGSVATTPTLGRVGAIKSDPPSNLPM